MFLVTTFRSPQLFLPHPLAFRYPDHKSAQSTSLDNVTLEDVVALAGEDHDALVEVVVLHGGGGVQDRQRRVRLM